MLWEGAILYCSQHLKHKNTPIPEKQPFDSSITFSQYQVYSYLSTHLRNAERPTPFVNCEDLTPSLAYLEVMTENNTGIVDAGFGN